MNLGVVDNMPNIIDSFRQLPLTFYLTFAAVFGVIFGSFSNVLIWRLPRKESILKPGSHCPHCNKPIRFYDNVPLLSYLILRGKCRDCHKHISARYPLVELLVALIAIWGIVVWQGDAPRQLLAFLLAPVLITLALIDIESMELPDSLITAVAVIGVAAVPLEAGKDFLTETGILLGTILVLSLLWRWAFGGDPTPEEEAEAEQAEPTIKERFYWGGGSFLVGLTMLVTGFVLSFRIEGWNTVWGLLVGGGGLLCLWGLFLFLQGREAIGLGDVKLMAALGIITGPGKILIAYIIGAVLGIFIWVVLRFLKKQGTDQPFPFGPALISGAWVAWLHGEQFLNWYMKFIFS